MNGRVSVATAFAAAIQNAVREPRAVPGAKLYDAPARVPAVTVTAVPVSEFAKLTPAVKVERKRSTRAGASYNLAPGIAGGNGTHHVRGREGGRYKPHVE